MHNKFGSKILAFALAAATATSSVMPAAVYATEPAGGETAAAEQETELVVETDAVDAGSEAAAAEATTTEEAAAVEENDEAAVTEDKAEAEEQKEETAPEKKEESKEEASETEEAEPAEKTDGSDEGKTVAPEKETAVPEEEKTDEPEKEKTEEPEEGNTTAAPEEEKEEEEIPVEKHRFRIFFDEGAGTVKVVIGSDEGASKDEPSVKITKNDGEKAEVSVRNDSVKEAIVEDDSEPALAIDLVKGEKITVYSESAEGFKVSQYSVETDAGGKKDIDPSYAELTIDGNTILTVGTEKEEVEKTGKVYVNILSDGGTLTISGKENTYEVSKDEKGVVTVKENGKAVDAKGGKYAFVFEAPVDEEMTATAKTEDGVITAFSIGLLNGTAYDDTSFKEEDKLDEFSQKFSVSEKDKMISVSFADMPEFEGEQIVDRVKVKIKAEKGVFPAGVTFKAEDIFNSDHAGEIVDAIHATDGYPKAAIDITFFDKTGKEIQPNGMVNVSFEDYEDKFLGYNDSMKVVHISDDGTLQEIEAETKGSDITVESDSFSPYIILGYNGGKDNVPMPGSDNGTVNKGVKAPDKVTFSSSDLQTYDYSKPSKASENKYYSDGEINRTTFIGVTDSDKGRGTAVCVDPWLSGALYWANKTKTHIETVTSANITKAIYYGTMDTEKIDSISDGHGESAVVAHFALAYLVMGCGLIDNSDFEKGDPVWADGRDFPRYEALWRLSSEQLRKDTAAFLNYVGRAPLPSNVVAYIVYPDNDRSSHGTQPYVYCVENSRDITVRLKKLVFEKSDSAWFAYIKGFGTNHNYDLDGAVYGIYKSKKRLSAEEFREKTPYKKVRLNSKGLSQWIKLHSDDPDERFFAVELKAPKGYVITGEVPEINAEEDDGKVFEVHDHPKRVKLQIQKEVDDNSVIGNEKIPSLAGAVFAIYRDPQHKDLIGKVTTGANGETNVLEVDSKGQDLPMDTYYGVEENAPAGYEKAANFEIDANRNKVSTHTYSTIKTTVKEKVQHLTVTVKKTSQNPGVTNGNAKYTLKGAKFEVHTTAACTDKAVATLVTDENGTATSSALPLGKYWVKEVGAPAGYKISSSAVEAKAASASTPYKLTATFSETPKTDPLDIKIQKSVRDALNPEKTNSLAGTVFQVDFYKGVYYKSKAELAGKKADKTWLLTAYEKDEKYLADFNNPKYCSGSEFYKDASGGKVLPLGTVVIREKTPAKGFKNNPDFGGGSDVYIGNVVESGEKAVTRDIVGARNTSNTCLTSDKEEIPSIVRTIAKDTTSKSQLSHAGSEITIEDTVELKNLVKGETYTIKGRLMDKATNKVVKDLNGKDVTAETTFTAKDIDTTETVTFKFKTNKEKFEGVTTVAFETLELTVDGNVTVLDKHENINDEAQTIHFPKIRTIASNPDTDEQVIVEGETARLKDTVDYVNLIPGQKYTLVGTVMSKSTEKPVTSATKTYDITTPDGKVDIEFTFDSTVVKNDTLVVYEKLYLGDKADKNKLVADHEDINDRDQTVRVLNVTTDAADIRTEEKAVTETVDEETGLAKNEKFIDDKVTFKGLQPGKEYVITGELKVKDGAENWDGAQTVESSIVKADAGDKGKAEIKDNTVVFTPAASGNDQFVDGVISIRFSFDASALKGKDIVVGEKVTRKGRQIAIHNDIKDDGQTVIIPKGETVAVDTMTGIKNSLAAENRIFKDTFSYENLEVGKEYIFTGRVMVADRPAEPEGEAVDGTDGKETGTDPAGETPSEEEPEEPGIREIDSVMVDAEGNPLEDGCFRFTPESENGQLELYFMIDAADIPNKDVIVFEDVTRNGILVIQHHVMDGTQTVYIPKGETEVIDSESQDQIAMPDEEVTVIDTLEYKNLIPGTTYTVKGRVMRKADVTEVPSTLTEAAFQEGTEGTVVSVEDSVVTFVPGSKDGAIELTFVFNASELKGEDVVLYERVYHDDSEVIIHENINDDAQTVHLPDGWTEAADPDTDDRTMMAKGDVTIRDRFHYKNLIPGDEYVIHGKVMLKPAEGEEAEELEAKMVDAEGNEIEEWIFTPEEKDGYEDVFFVVNADELAARSVVMFETMEFINPELQTRTVIVVHEDIDDEDQTIHFPDGGTTALDSETEDHISNADTEVTIFDEIKYQNLIPGKTYTVTGTMMDKETNEPVMINGEKLTVTDEFIPEEADGSHIMTFTFDGSALKGKNIVAFETVYSNGKEVFIHADLEDEDQTVHFPDGGTTALDSKTEDHITFAEKKAVIYDEVKYQNLLPGKTYTVTGVLMDKTTSEPLLVDGKEVTATETFTAEEAEGSIVITFRLDASALEGITTVAFETVKYKDKEVFVHADINDKDQTIHIPGGGTTATDDKTKGHTAYPGQKTTIVDEVKYQNLLPGKTYTVSGTLMDKKTRKPLLVNGKEVTVTKTFTADKANGSIEIRFTLDASKLAGKSVVAFETMQYNGKNVFVHADLNDADQTVDFPSVNTSASDKSDGDKKINPTGTVTVVDKVTYTNLTPGKKYVVTGTLMSKSTKNAARSGGKNITGQAAFTAEKADGTVNVEFKFNASDLQTGEYVVFEELYEVSAKVGKNVLIGEHKDINDKAQTVTRPNPPVNPHRSTPRTDDTRMLFVWIGVIAAVAAAVAGVLVVRRRKNK